MNEEKKETFTEMIKKGTPTYNIIYLVDNNDYKYCLLNKNDKFYYIQANGFLTYDLSTNYTITLYNKKSPNEKQQADYSKGVNNLQDILNYISRTKSKTFKDLKDTHKQTVFYQLSIINNGKTIFQHLKDVAGYRENYILKNLDRIEEKDNRKDYHILRFIDNNGNYFEINTYNIIIYIIINN